MLCVCVFVWIFGLHVTSLNIFHVSSLLQWEKLQMTASERRKIMCSVTFHVIAITCVVWSLYVLIDRTADEIRQGQHRRRLTNTHKLINVTLASVLGFAHSSTVCCSLQVIHVYHDKLQCYFSSVNSMKFCLRLKVMWA